MEDLGSVCPFVQNYVADTLRILDLPIAEQVMVVPKISCSPCPSRSLVPEPQTAEQLVEVPTVLSPSRIALQIAEQIVDTPVPRGRVQRRVQGSLPGLSSTATLSSGKRISERIVEQIADFLEQTVEQIVDISPGGGLGQGSSSPAGPADEDFTGVFALFPMTQQTHTQQTHLHSRHTHTADTHTEHTADTHRTRTKSTIWANWPESNRPKSSILFLICWSCR